MSSDYETAYAHLSNFGENVHPGVMLQPGDVLGYVGSTGVSTAPHLHLETLFRGEPVDPLCSLPAAFQSISMQRSVSPKPITKKAPLRVSAARKSRKSKHP